VLPLSTAEVERVFSQAYNEILTFIIYTWANRSVYSTNQPRYNSIFLSLTLKKLGNYCIWHMFITLYVAI
jgi:hypothetical protein